MKSSNLLYVFLPRVRRNIRDRKYGRFERRRENVGTRREKSAQAFPYKYLKLAPPMAVWVPNKNLTDKLVTLNAILFLEGKRIYTDPSTRLTHIIMKTVRAMFPSVRTLNEINIVRIDVQLVSFAIIQYSNMTVRSKTRMPFPRLNKLTEQI